MKSKAIILISERERRKIHISQIKIRGAEKTQECCLENTAIFFLVLVSCSALIRDCTIRTLAMSASPEVDSEESDSTHEMSYASGTTSLDGSDHTQTMNFDDYIEWHEAAHPSPNPDTPPESVLSPVRISPGSRGIAANLPYRVTDETI